MAGLYTLSGNERLNSRKLIEKIFKREGEFISKFPLSFIFMEHSIPENVPAQVMFSVPSRKVKKAHKRIHIKRLMRECYRLNKPFFYKSIQSKTNRQYICCLMYNSDKAIPYAELEEKFKYLLSEFDKKVS